MVDPRVKCPDCGARVPQDPGFTPWCGCGWNLDAPDAARPRNLTEQAYLALGNRHGTALYERVKQTETTRPRASLRRFLLVLLSVGVLLTTPLLLVGAVLLVAVTWFNLFAVLGGLFLVAFAWLLRPRLFSIPDEQILDPSEHPHLVRVVGDVAERIGARAPDVIAANADFNAGVGTLGHGRRRGLVLGLPLLATLDNQEVVALLGHELAHLVHGDEGRLRLISTALQTVAAWCEILTPNSFWEQGEGPEGMLAALSSYVVSFVPRTLLQVMVHLEWSDSQLSEYHADRLAATVAGSEGARRLIDKFLLAGTFQHAVHRVVHGRTDRAILAEVTHLAGALPPRERERLHRLASVEAPVLDATHPPEGLRARMLEERPHLRGTYVLRSREREAIERELAGSMRRVERDLANAYRSALHGL